MRLDEERGDWKFQDRMMQKTSPPRPARTAPRYVAASALVLFGVLVGIVGSSPGCSGKSPQPDPNAVAFVEGIPIHRDRLLESWTKRAQGAATPVPSSTVLADLVDTEAAYQQAQRSGFVERPDVKAALRNFVVARYKEDKYAALLSLPEPPETEVREAYAMRREHLVKPPAVNLALLFLQVPRTATPEKRGEALQLLTGWRERIASAKDPAKAFAELVAAHSSDTATRYRRGELGWLTAEQMVQRLPKELITSAMALTNGVLSQPLQAPDGFYLLRCLGQRPGQIRPYEEVANLLRHDLREERRRASEQRFREEIRAGLVIRTNVTLLESLILTNKPAQPPPSMPKG
jgi:hypothetical protein